MKLRRRLCKSGKVLRLWRKIRSLGEEFLENTSMHGLKYIGGDHRPVIERLLWVLLFGIGVGLTAVLCTNMMDKFSSSVAVMSIVTANKRLVEYPFPSITICNQNKISKTKLLRLLNENSRYAQLFSVHQLLLMMSVLMQLHTANHQTQSELHEIDRIMNENGISVTEAVNMTLQVIVTCEDMLLDCIYKLKVTKCSQLFDMKPTDDGHCCSFNPIETGWKLGSEKLEGRKIDSLEHYGHSAGLTVAIDANLDDYTSPTVRSNGFKLLVHNAPEYADVGERGLLISPGFEINLGIYPVACDNVIELDYLPVDNRGCYVDSENNLNYYNFYTVSRCLVECRTKQMLNKCSCRPYYYAAKETDPICNLEGHICLYDVLVEFKNSSPFSQCEECLARCHDVWFYNDMSLASFPGQLFLDSDMGERIKVKKTNLSDSELIKYLRKNVVVLNTFYAVRSGFLYLNDVPFSIGDFIASIGGLLTVGFGFSVISAIEVVYYVLIRWYFKESPKLNEEQNNLSNDAITGRRNNVRQPQIPTRRRRRGKIRRIRVYPKLELQQQQQIYSIPTFETSLARYLPDY